MRKFLLFLALIIGCFGNLAAITPLTKERLEHSQPHYANVSNGVIEYYDFGKGSPIVLIAGYGSNVNSWDWRFLSALASQHRVIIFDNRNVAGTKITATTYTSKDLADDTYHLINALQLNKPAILGISMGGMIAQQYAISHPDAMSKLVLINTAIAGTHSVPPSLAVQKEMFTPPRSTVELYMRAIKLFFPPQWQPRMAAELLIDRFHSVYIHEVMIGNATLLKQQKLVRTWSRNNRAQEQIAHMSKPTLILNGGADIVIPPINAVILAKTIPHAQLLRWAEGGHSMIYQFPYPLAAAINQFLLH